MSCIAVCFALLEFWRRLQCLLIFVLQLSLTFLLSGGRSPSPPFPSCSAPPLFLKTQCLQFAAVTFSKSGSDSWQVGEICPPVNGLTTIKRLTMGDSGGKRTEVRILLIGDRYQLLTVPEQAFLCAQQKKGLKVAHFYRGYVSLNPACVY